MKTQRVFPDNGHHKNQMTSRFVIEHEKKNHFADCLYVRKHLFPLQRNVRLISKIAIAVYDSAERINQIS